MKSKPVLLLLLLTTAAMAYFFLIEQPRHRQRAITDSESVRLVQFSPDEVTRVIIERSDVTLEFEREGNGWRMTRPVEDGTEPASINVLVHAITRGEIYRRFAAEQLADFGLAVPHAAIQLVDGSGKTLLALDVGSLTMTSEFAYARFADGAEVMLVPTGIRRYAMRDVFAFRSKTVANFEASDVTQVEIESPARSMRWSKSDDDRWTSVVDGDTLRGDAGEILSVLRRVLAARATAFVDEGVAGLFAPPAGTISVQLPAGGSSNFTFSRRDSSGCYVIASGARRVARVDASVLDIFLLENHDLRDRHVVSFDESSLTGIRLTTGGLSLSIVKRGPQWTFSNPQFGAVDQAAVTVMIRELQNLKFRAIIDETLDSAETRGLDPPAYRLDLLGSEDRILDSILAAPVQAEGRVRDATSLSSGHLGTIDSEPLDGIEALFRDFRAP